MRAIDGMLGLAIGDAMGIPIKFQDRNTLLKKPITKMTGYGNFNVPKGTWSDDTALSLATMDSLTKCKKIDYNDLMKRFCKWINNGQYTSDGSVFDIGNTTRFSLMRYYNDKLGPFKCGGIGITENGPGSLMRMFPLAYYSYFIQLNQDQISYIALTTSSLTHAHPISCLGCYIYIMFINFILNGFTKEQSYIKIQHLDYSFFKKGTMKYYERILKNDISTLDISEIKSTGYIVDILEASFWVILNTNSFEESIIGAINLGGYTDTIGSVTGSIAGLIYGSDNIPTKWIDTLQNGSLIYKLCSKFEASLKE